MKEPTPNVGVELQKLRLEFYSAAVKLQNAWLELDQDDLYLISKYPFSESFNEVVANIGVWVQAEVCRNEDDVNAEQEDDPYERS